MQKIIDSKGLVHNSCPYIDKIILLCDSQQEIIVSIKSELELVRAINSKLRENQDDNEEIWLQTGYRGNRAKWSSSELEELVKRVSELEDQNKNLLNEIDNLKN